MTSDLPAQRSKVKRAHTQWCQTPPTPSTVYLLLSGNALGVSHPTNLMEYGLHRLQQCCRESRTLTAARDPGSVTVKVGQRKTQQVSVLQATLVTRSPTVLDPSYLPVIAPSSLPHHYVLVHSQEGSNQQMTTITTRAQTTSKGHDVLRVIDNENTQ